MVARDLDPGIALGRYRLEVRIGEGGMGSVWRARDEVLERDVALKVLPRMLVSDPSAQRRFEREARAMGRLQHPNVVGIYDIGTADPGTGEELPFLVMELVRGRPLIECMADRTMPRLRILRWMEQVARALAAAHQAGIVHRDLKPSNIMVDDEDHVVVLDFGLARLTQRDGEVPEETLTTPGMVLGSCPYMAPEQALGEEVTPASDLFSFGAVLYEALAGSRAFTGDTPMHVLRAVVKGETVPLEDLAPGLPQELYEVVERCMAREPGQRYSSAAELANDLALVAAMEATSTSGLKTTVDFGGNVKASRLRRARRRRLTLATAAAALVVGAAVGLWGGRAGREPLRPDPGRWTMTELFQGRGSFMSPSWSPDGALLAVSRAEGDRGEVLLVPVDGDEPRVLVAGGGQEAPSHPTFSPDSAALAVSVLSGSSQRLRVYPVVGGPAVAEIDNALHGAWLDGTTLAFSRMVDGRSSIWTADLETGEETLLVDARDDVSWWDVRSRPGGGLVLLGGASDFNAGLFVSDASGMRIEQWLAPGRRVSSAEWTPGGRTLVTSIGGQLALVGAGGVRPLLPADAEAFRYPAFSAQGRLAAVQNRSGYDIVSVDPDSGRWECVLCGMPGAGWGTTGIDGSVAYRLPRGGLDQVVIQASDGTTTTLSAPGESATCPVLSPDATRVAYLAQTEGRTDLRVRSRWGGEPVTLATDVEASELVSWSPDGSRIAFAAGSPLQVWVVSAAGGRARALSPPGGDYPQWSPDGERIAYAVWTEASDPAQGTWVVPATGGEPEKVSEWPTRVVWDPSSGDLLQLRRSDDALELWRAEPGRWIWTRRSLLDLGGRPPIQMEHLPLTVDPSSGRLVMNRRSGTASLVVFDGLDPERW
jgi:serine/threonine protein kinase/Tol biopolymer transport system component